MLNGKHMRIQGGQPLLARLRQAQIVDPVTDIAMHHLPVELRIGTPQVVRGRIAQACINAGFCKLIEERREFVQIARVGQLPNQIRGPHQTALEPGELIVRVRFPAPAARSGAGFHEVSARYRDYCQVAAAAVVSLEGPADLVLLRVAPTPFHVDASSALDDDGALEGLLDGIEPEDDVEASAAHRRRVAAVLARRALSDAAANARAGVSA